MAAIFTAVDLSTVAAFVTATLVLVIGVRLLFKGGDIGKRAISKA